MKRNNYNKGFTLLELLAVLAIISILAGMIGVTAHNARQRAYDATAKTEVQQIAMAFKAYWIANGKWPDGFIGKEVQLTEAELENSGLLGGGKKGGYVYLEISPDSFQGDGDEKYFLDPWGNPYVVTLDQVSPTEAEDEYQGVVRFLNSEKHYYDLDYYAPGK